MDAGLGGNVNDYVMEERNYSMRCQTLHALLDGRHRGLLPQLPSRILHCLLLCGQPYINNHRCP